MVVIFTHLKTNVRRDETAECFMLIITLYIGMCLERAGLAYLFI